MGKNSIQGNVAFALLKHLSRRGVDLFLGNAGTDFCSLIEAFALGEEEGTALPRPLPVAHESVLMSMAQGYYLATGRPAGVMVHVGVGTANALGSLMAASRSRIPVILLAGRTPVTQAGSAASRGAVIHWGQEMFDQAAMVREWCKWDYELRRPEELATVLDRALTLALSEPQGPVYLTLPREVLMEKYDWSEPETSLRRVLPTMPPDTEQIRVVAGWLAKSKKPLIITSASGREAEGVHALAALAETAGAAVVSVSPEFMNLPTAHPCHQGFQSEGRLSEADFVLVVECTTPWIPNRASPRQGARVVHVGRNPLFQDVPIRHFPSDMTLRADPVLALKALEKEVQRHPEWEKSAAVQRLESLRRDNERLRNAWRGEARGCAVRTPMSPAYASCLVGELFGKKAVVFNEYDNSLRPFAPDVPGRYFGVSPAGFLGWGLGAALGYKLGKPGAMTVAAVGDGSYLFGVPASAHQFAAAYQTPFLTLIYNNGGWGAVRRATRGLHPDGRAAASGKYPLTRLEGTENLHRIVEAFGGHGESVRGPVELEGALRRAEKAVLEEKRQAVVNLLVDMEG